MVNLAWLPEAVEDLGHLLASLQERSPEAACRAALAVRRVADRLGECAVLGRPMADGTGRRELRIPFAGAPQTLCYGLDEGGGIVVIRVKGGVEPCG